VIEVGQQLETKTSMYDGNFTTRPSANFGKKTTLVVIGTQICSALFLQQIRRHRCALSVGVWVKK
jgi:hypothetical protein